MLGENPHLSMPSCGLRGGYLHLMSSDTWSYKSFGGLVKAAAAAQPLSDDEWALLEKILGETE